jgi:hypothetical protein
MADITSHSVSGGTLTVTTPGKVGSDPIGEAAKLFGIPRQILWGVYGIETDFGRNVKTSSAGAIGPFQFLPATAHAFGYPLTNTPSAAQFGTQARSAARYLAVLHDAALKRGLRGDAAWNDALQHYSGGGYGLGQVTAKATGKDAPAETQAAPSGPLSGLTNPLKAAEGFLNLLTNPQTWLRLVEIVMGAALLLMGLKSFSGGAVDPLGAVPKVIPV